MQYTSNYNFSKPEADDIINPASRSGYNGNFDTIDTTLKSVSNKADTNESNIADLTDQITILYDLIVPVGSVLCFANDTNPNYIYQGTTWEKIEGKFLLGSSNDYALGSTGGEATHTLTVDEMPSHRHKMLGSDLLVNTGSGNYSMKQNPAGGLSTDFAGGGQAHNNMPPYEVVNYWKRTA